jgi:hypothetical protein
LKTLSRDTNGSPALERREETIGSISDA